MEIVIFGVLVSITETALAELSAEGACFAEFCGPNGDDVLLVKRLAAGWGFMSYYHGTALEMSVPLLTE